MLKLGKGGKHPARNKKKPKVLTREVDDRFVRGRSAFLKEELVEVLAARCQHSFVRTVLLAFDQQRDVTELIVETLLVEFVQHGLAVFGQELIDHAFTVNLKNKTHFREKHQFYSEKKKTTSPTCKLQLLFSPPSHTKHDQFTTEWSALILKVQPMLTR